MSDEQEQIDILKELITEVRVLNQRVQALEAENNTLAKAMNDPEMLMRKQGWKKFTTPRS